MTRHIFDYASHFLITRHKNQQVLSVQLACEKCKEEGKAVDCVHMLHLVPRWQSGERHTRLKTIMQVTVVGRR